MRSLFSLLAPLLVGAVAGADVLVVDPLGGGDFTQLQAAVDGAADGDTILVKPGAYTAVDLASKGVAIIADGPTVEVIGGIQISNTLVEHDILLVGLTLLGTKPAQSTGVPERPALDLFLVRGSLRVEDCEITGAVPPSDCEVCLPLDCAAGHAVRGELVLDAAFSRCSIAGGDAVGLFYIYFGLEDNAGGHAAWLRGGNVAFYDCTLSGGDGFECEISWCDLDQGGHGGHGLLGVDATAAPMRVFVSGSTLSGGEGGDGALCICSAGDGGDGAQIVGSDAILWTLETAMSGGGGGCGGNNPPRGKPLRLKFGAKAVDFPGVARSLSGPNPWREGDAISLSFDGRAGDLVWLLSSVDAGWLLRRPFGSVALLATPGLQHSTFVAKLGPSGLFDLVVNAPALPAGAESHVIYTQGLFRDTLGTVRLSAPLSVLVLDDAF